MAINENKIVNKIRMFYICFANNTLYAKLKNDSTNIENKI